MRIVCADMRTRLAYSVLLALAFAVPSVASVRLMGSLGVQTLGYEDAAGEDHLWLYQRTRLTVAQTDGPLLFRFSGGYIGDNSDNFGDSGRFRLFEGNLRYGDFGSRFTARLGRFFLYKGVGLGVVDGLEVSYAFTRRWAADAFAGLMGPKNRKFELEDPDQSFSFGGRVRWNPTRFPLLGRSSFSLSYARQKREGGVFRNLTGLSTRHRVTPSWTWFNVLHVRPTESPLRKFTSRLRWHTEEWNALAEFGFMNSNVADLSWFSGFGVDGTSRIRVVLDRYVVPKRWAGGIQASILNRGDKSGFRGGPVLTSPWGQVGYRLSAGDFAHASGPWISLRAIPTPGIDLYAHGAFVSYEWDAFDIESDDLTMIHVGVRYRPTFFNSITVNAEFQAYQTPQLAHDRRVMGGVSWRFDTGPRGR